MQQDPQCNRRKNARLLGLPQQVGGLGLQVSAISIMCQDPTVFRSMMLANTPCPINDTKTGRLLMGKNAINKYREDPATFVVGYADDKEFWDTLLRVGEEYDEEEIVEDTTPKLSISDRFRSTKRRGSGSKFGESNINNRTSSTTTGNRDGGSKPNNDRSEKLDYLIESLGAIKNRVTDGATMTVGATGYAALGGVIVDDAMNDALITQTELDNYLEAHDLVMNHDYATATNAQELFTQEYQGAMNSLDEAITLLTDASTEVLTATGIMEAAAAADTAPEQAALQA